jgi:hypothetical protein
VCWSFAFNRITFYTHTRTLSFTRTIRSLSTALLESDYCVKAKNVPLGKLQKLWTIRATETEEAIHFTTRGKRAVAQK